MDWFRSHHGAPLDYKLSCVTVNYRALHVDCNAATVSSAIIALWWILLDFASQQDTRGSVAGFRAELIDTHLALPLGMCAALVDVMRDLKLIIDDRITNWEKRQFAGGSPSTERVRAFRERKKEERNTAKPKETKGNARKLPDTDTEKDSWCGGPHRRS